MHLTDYNLNGVVVIVAICNTKGAGFDSREMLGIFPLLKRGKEAKKHEIKK
jgi:hypothetical protein